MRRKLAIDLAIWREQLIALHFNSLTEWLGITKLYTQNFKVNIVLLDLSTQHPFQGP